MREQFRPIATNLTPVNVVGIPGLMLVVVAIALAIQFPEVRWLILATVTGGSVIAALLIRRRWRRFEDDDGDPSHGMLHVYEPAAAPQNTPSRHAHFDGVHVLVPAGT